MSENNELNLEDESTSSPNTDETTNEGLSFSKIIAILLVTILLCLSSGVFFIFRTDSIISGHKINNIGKYYDKKKVDWGIYQKYDFDDKIMPWSDYESGQGRIVKWSGQVEVEVFITQFNAIQNQYKINASILVKDFTSTKLGFYPNEASQNKISINKGFMEISQESKSILEKDFYEYIIIDEFEVISSSFIKDSYHTEKFYWNQNTKDFLSETTITSLLHSSIEKDKETVSYSYVENKREHMNPSYNHQYVWEYENGWTSSYSSSPATSYYEPSYKPNEFKFENSLYIS